MSSPVRSVVRRKVRISPCVLTASSRSSMYLMRTEGAPANADPIPSSGREVMSTRKFGSSLERFLARNLCKLFRPVTSPLQCIDYHKSGTDNMQILKWFQDEGFKQRRQQPTS